MKTYSKILFFLCLTVSAHEIFSQVYPDARNLNSNMSWASQEVYAQKEINMIDGFSYHASSPNTFVAEIAANKIQIDHEAELSRASGGTGGSGASSGEVGATPTSFNVTPVGAMTYAIPIKVSPGISGMEPNLSIVYNSQGRDGLLGYGFSLAGLSSITRVRRTQFHDGIDDIVPGIGYGYVLDGARMVSVGSGQYRLLDNSRMAKIVGTQNNGHYESFVVYEKSGLIKYYGQTSNSRVSVTDGTSDLGEVVMLLNRVEDRKGNYMTIEYTNGAKEIYPKKISYTGNGTTDQPFASVEFSYNTRSKPAFAFVGRSERTTSKMLTKIVSKYGTSVYREYVLGYTANDNIPHLTSVTEKNGSGQALKPIVFKWNIGDPRQYENSYGALVLRSNTRKSDFSYTSHAGDFDGDGKAEMLNILDKANQWAYYGNPAGTSVSPTRSGNLSSPIEVPPVYGTSQYDILSPGYTVDWQRSVGDVNGDGKTDIIEVNPHDGSYVIYGLNGSSFTVTEQGKLLGVHRDMRFSTGDFNGDGETDIIAMRYAANSGNPFIEYKLYKNKFGMTESFDQLNPWQTFTFNLDPNLNKAAEILDAIQLGDFNGDGKMDFFVAVGWTGHPSRIYYGHKNGFYLHEDANLDLADSYDHKSFIKGDFNGDGKLDIIQKTVLPAYTETINRGPCLPVGNGGDTECICELGGVPNAQGICYETVTTSSQDIWHVYFGSDYGFEKKTISSPPLGTGTKLFAGDVNGDSKSDIFMTPNSGGSAKVYTLASTTWIELVSSSFNVQSKSEFTLADFTGNGVSDILERYEPQESQSTSPGSTTSTYTTSVGYSLFADYVDQTPLVNEVINSNGVMTFIEYAPLTDSKVYTKGVGRTNTNTLDVQFSMHVVSAVHSDDALGGLNTTKYRYKHGVVHRHGNGFMGFEDFFADNITQGATIRQRYRFDNTHYVALLQYQYTIARGTLVGSSSVQYKSVNDETAFTYLIAKDRESISSYDPNSGTLLSKQVITYPEYDKYGNVKKMNQSYTGTSIATVTTSEYSNTEASWLIGRLKKSTVTKTGASGDVGTRSSSFEYYADGYLKTETIEPDHTLKLATTYTYDKYGNITGSTSTGSGESRTEAMTFIAATDYRFPSSVTNNLGQTASMTYDQVTGNILTSKDPNNHVTTNLYDNWGRVIKVTDHFGNFVDTQYSWAQGLGPSKSRYFVRSTPKSGTGGAQTTYYDRLGRVLRTTTTGFNGGSINVDQEYNNQGLVSKKSDPYFDGGLKKWHYFEYDGIGRVVRQMSPGERETLTAYNGYETAVTNPEKQVNKTKVNQLGQIVWTEDANGKKLNFTYDAHGLQKTVTDTKNTTTTAYDKLGNAKTVTDPDLGTMHYTYNAFGEVLTHTGADGNVATYTYDGLGRPKTLTESKAGVLETTTWTYDTKVVGALTTVTKSNNTSVTNDYDAKHRLSKVTEQIDGKTYETLYTYDDNFNRLDELTYPSGFKIKHGYNAQGVLDKIYDPANTTHSYWTALEVNARGQLEAYDLGNGTRVRRQHELATGNLIGMQASHIGTIVQDMSFSYNKLNTLTSRSDYMANDKIGLTEEFSYDNLNRLTTSSILGKSYGGLVMAYDALGNITSKSDVGTYAYHDHKPHAIKSITNESGIIPATTQSITYNAFDKVVEITEGAARLAFTYGTGHERKMTKTYLNDQLINTKVFVGGIYEKETTTQGTRELHYIRGGGELIAIHAIENASTKSTLYVLNDHLGSISALMDATGKVVERYSYDAWGKRRDANTWNVLSGGVDQTLARGFTGHEHLGLFSLINMNGRVYDPVLGRFLSADPFVQFPYNLQSYNRYSYVLNNPLSFTDPSGYFSLGDAVGAVLGTAVTVVLSPFLGPAAFAVGGFVGSFASTLVDGGSVGDAFEAAVISGAMSFLTAGFATGFEHTLFSGIGSEVLRTGLSYAASGALMAATQGGNVWRGAAASAIGSLGGMRSSDFASGLIVASLAGGTSSMIGGGNFKDGALTAAISYTVAYGLKAHMSSERYQNNQLKRQANRAYRNWRRSYNIQQGDMLAIGGPGDKISAKPMSVIEWIEWQQELAFYEDQIRQNYISIADRNSNSPWNSGSWVENTYYKVLGGWSELGNKFFGKGASIGFEWRYQMLLDHGLGNLHDQMLQQAVDFTNSSYTTRTYRELLNHEKLERIF